MLKAAKESDYFTRSLPYAQKGNAVTLPLGSTAPIIAGTSVNALGNPLKFDTANNIQNGSLLGINSQYVSAGTTADGFTGNNTITKTNLLADLSTATAASINQLRFAFQYQKEP